MTSKQTPSLPWLVFSFGAAAIVGGSLGAGCGANDCSDAESRVKECLNEPTSDSTTTTSTTTTTTTTTATTGGVNDVNECSGLDQCFARCKLKASCGEIVTYDRLGSAAGNSITECMTSCAESQSGGSPSSTGTDPGAGGTGGGGSTSSNPTTGGGGHGGNQGGGGSGGAGGGGAKAGGGGTGGV